MGRAGVFLLLFVFVAIAVALFVMVENLPEIRPREVERETAKEEEAAPRTEAPADPSLVGSGDAAAKEAPAAADSNAPFRGHVVDENGRPVAGARVMARIFYRQFSSGSDREYAYRNDPLDAKPRLWTTTEARGRFGLDPASVESLIDASTLDAISALGVQVKAKGYPRHLARVPRGQETEIRIVPGGTLGFTVRLRDGTPVEGATLRVFHTEEPAKPLLGPVPPIFASLTSDTEGRAAVAAPPGTYRMRARSKGLAPRDLDPVEVVAGETHELEVVLDEGVVANVHVTGPEGEPVAGAEVEVRARLHSGAKTTTDPDGRCRIAGLVVPVAEKGDRALGHWGTVLFYRVMAKGYAFAEGSRLLPPEAGDMPLEMRLKRGVEVALRAVDETGAPAPKAWAVIVFDRNAMNPIQGSPSYAAGEDGWIHLPRFPPGARNVQVGSQEPGYRTAYLELEVKGEDIRQDVVLASTGASVSGRVLLPDGTPAEGARVGVAPAGADPVTQASYAGRPANEDGTFHVRQVTGGEHLVVYRAPAYGVHAAPITVRPNESREGLVLKLRDDDRIGGVLRTREGEPAPGVVVMLWVQYTAVRGTGAAGRSTTSAAELATTTSDAEGRFLFRGVSDGTLRVTVRSDDWKLSWPRPDGVHPGDEDLVVTLKPASEGEGILLLAKVTADGAPYVGPLSVQARPPGKESWEYSLEVDHRKDGVYEVRSGWPPGTYGLRFRAPGWRAQDVEAIEIEDTGVPTELRVALDRGAALTLRVLDAEGRPLRHTLIRVHNEQIKTDDRGEIVLTGFEPGTVDHLYISRVDDANWSWMSLADVPVPGRTDVVLKPCGTISLKTSIPYAEVKTDAVFRLHAADGTMIEERRKTVDEMRRYGGNLGSYFQVYEEGTYRVTLDLGDAHAEATVEAGPRRRVTVDLDPR